MASELEEFIQFLTPSSRPDVKNSALDAILRLTATSESRCMIRQNTTLLKSLVSALDDSQALPKTVLGILANLSDDDGIIPLIDVDTPCLLEFVLQQILKKESNLELLCVLLNNLSRSEDVCAKIQKSMESETISLEKLADVFCNNEGKVSSQVHHLAGVLSNLSQNGAIRKYLLNEGKDVFLRLLSFTMYESSSVRRDGVAGMIRNCCFDTEFHDVLLSEGVDILPHLLLPLAGPEEFSEDEMAELPLELQYLGETKQREPDPAIRKKLLECLAQLCATKVGRAILRKKQAYLILRELHNWEKEPTVLFACENAVQLLIGDEPEPGMSNLKDVEIPHELVKKFENMDKEFINPVNKSTET